MNTHKAFTIKTVETLERFRDLVKQSLLDYFGIIDKVGKLTKDEADKAVRNTTEAVYKTLVTELTDRSRWQS